MGLLQPGPRPALAWETDSSATHPVLAPPMPCPACGAADHVLRCVVALLAAWVSGQCACLRSARIHATPLFADRGQRRAALNTSPQDAIHAQHAVARGWHHLQQQWPPEHSACSRFRLEEGVRGPRVTAPSRGASATRPWASAASMRCPPQIGCRCARSWRRMGSDPHAHNIKWRRGINVVRGALHTESGLTRAAPAPHFYNNRGSPLRIWGRGCCDSTQRG